MSLVSQSHVPWIEKYRPKNISELTQDSNLLSMFKKCLETQETTHLLFHGPPGTGKTSAIQALGRELFKEYYSERIIEFNASDDRGINAVREKITNQARKFVTAAKSVDGSSIPPYKIIILDEADSMTDEAQDALRVIIEQYSKVTRFCFICNYITKITDAIKSRCVPVYFKKLTHDCMLNKLKQVTKTEEMNIPEDILNTIIDVSIGDMRKAIMLLQNLKYLYLNKALYKKPIHEFTEKETNYIKYMTFNKYFSKKVEINDVYKLAGILPPVRIEKIINLAIDSASYKQLQKLADNIISIGYPIDNILLQINQRILERTDITDEHKSSIYLSSADMVYRVKEGGNEYIQLLHMLSTINNVIRTN